MKVKKLMFCVFCENELLCTFAYFDDAFLFLNNRFDAGETHDFSLKAGWMEVVTEEVPF
jgi:hypothetical protein